MVRIQCILLHSDISILYHYCYPPVKAPSTQSSQFADHGTTKYGPPCPDSEHGSPIASWQHQSETKIIVFSTTGHYRARPPLINQRNLPYCESALCPPHRGLAVATCNLFSQSTALETAWVILALGHVEVVGSGTEDIPRKWLDGRFSRRFSMIVLTLENAVWRSHCGASRPPSHKVVC